MALVLIVTLRAIPDIVYVDVQMVIYSLFLCTCGWIQAQDNPTYDRYIIYFQEASS